jgi:hypothetical protein
VFRGCEQGLLSCVKQWGLYAYKVIFIKGTNELDGEVEMNEVTCTRVMTDNGAVYVPVANIKVIENLKSACLHMFNGAGMPAWNAELDNALNVLRVYATNTLNKVEK